MAADTLVIFGAGASRAASPFFPLVNDVFKITGQFVQRDIYDAGQMGAVPSGLDSLWALLGQIESKRLWRNNNPAVYSHSHQLDHILHPADSSPIKIRDSMREYISWMLSLNSGNSGTSIEHVVTRAEEISYFQHDNAVRAALYKFLTWLFFRVEKTAELDYRKTPHAVFVDTLAKMGLLRQSLFVSFNYDMVLERSIRALDDPQSFFWHAICGYGFECPGYYSLRDGKIKRERVRRDQGLILLKPHGSLAWARQRQGDDVFPIVDDREPYGGRPIVPTENQDLEKIFEQDGLEPVIIAPGRIKRLAGQHSWSTWRVLKAAIQSHVKKVVVIGWNVPETDEDIKGRINSYIDGRSEGDQIEKLIICDPNPSSAFHDRMSMIFMPKTTVHLKKGFEQGASEIVGHLAG